MTAEIDKFRMALFFRAIARVSCLLMAVALVVLLAVVVMVVVTIMTTINVKCQM